MGLYFGKKPLTRKTKTGTFKLPNKLWCVYRLNSDNKIADIDIYPTKLSMYKQQYRLERTSIYGFGLDEETLKAEMTKKYVEGMW